MTDRRSPMSTRLTAVAVLALLAACGPGAAPEPSPGDAFCAAEPDGDYLNPDSCRSYVVCADKRVAEVRACPPGEVLDPYGDRRPIACQPHAETRLNADCSIKPLPLADAAAPAPVP